MYVARCAATTRVATHATMRHGAAVAGTIRRASAVGAMTGSDMLRWAMGRGGGSCVLVVVADRHGLIVGDDSGSCFNPVVLDER